MTCALLNWCVSDQICLALRNMSEKLPDNHTDPRKTFWRRLDVTPNEFWCDTCSHWWDYHYVLYRVGRRAAGGKILECPSCFAAEVLGSQSEENLQRARQIFRSRLGKNRPERRRAFESPFLQISFTKGA